MATNSFPSLYFLEHQSQMRTLIYILEISSPNKPFVNSIDDYFLITNQTIELMNPDYWSLFTRWSFIFIQTRSKAYHRYQSSKIERVKRTEKWNQGCHLVLWAFNVLFTPSPEPTNQWIDGQGNWFLPQLKEVWWWIDHCPCVMCCWWWCCWWCCCDCWEVCCCGCCCCCCCCGAAAADGV